MSKYIIGLKTRLLQRLSEPEFDYDGVLIQKNNWLKDDFPYHFNKIIVCLYEKDWLLHRCFATDGMLSC